MKPGLAALLGVIAVAAAGCCNSNPASSTTGAAGSTSNAATGSGTSGLGSSGGSGSATGAASTGSAPSSSGANASSGSNGASQGTSGSNGTSGGASAGLSSSTGASSAAGTSGALATGGASSAGATGGTAGAATSGSTTGVGYGGSSSTGAVPNTVLLVDNDGYVNDGSSPSDDAALPIYKGLMTGHGFQSYDTVSIDSNGDQSWNVSNTVVALPTAAQLAQYDVVVWFTSDNGQSAAGTDQPVSSDQESTLAAWLDLGDKKLILISPFLVGLEQGATSAQTGSWTFTFTDPLFTNDLFLVGGVVNPYNCISATSCAPFAVPYGVSGSSLVSSAFGMTEYYVQAPTSPLLEHNGAVAAILNPGNSVDTVATVSASPVVYTANQTVAVTVGARQIGAMGSSTIVLVSYPPEAIVAGSVGSGLSGPQVFFDGVLTYAGVP